ncbi:hypothetical protein HNY42_08180 [Exiguobacterium sp. Helios]|uniref:DUF3885 domain-containing protein n=1 Tax=Exiguobacterium sp. Helios TaxID=2735868 RepID=UPI00165D7B45|nr:hypothetical protein [Exiguobacterium sp. Helios]QNR20912.1 hypothetical protein HNY42_08180 [Exiguobacterium sp. Helios]
MKLKDYFRTHFDNPDILEESFAERPLTLSLDLQKELYQIQSDSDELNMAYFDKVYQKSLTLFEDLFHENDRLYLIVRVRKELHSPPAKSTEIFERYLKNKKNRYALEFEKKDVRDEEEIIYQYARLLPSRKSLRYKKLLQAICNQDFPELYPRFKSRQTYYPVIYFVNPDKDIILYIFDDRGCFILLNEENTFQYLNEKYRLDQSEGFLTEEQ